ncbi:hypothetical protein LO772_26740 [Yinghuangia sp. ASG 101]|uniref:hypothetical protein n=1 Tax=Yinghuangia sp. ASG 101 TaxID=2896848 RepID=UPI001E56F8D8|nr:hypothetical protein [Yinghuangia sp. ASG 101]UGQ10420.1 hypothetical protein LO772_26740 [Yinghuangia sp. ASG 101]
MTSTFTALAYASARAAWRSHRRLPEATAWEFPAIDQGSGEGGTTFRPFVRAMAGPADLAARPVLSRPVDPCGLPLVVLIAWGVDAIQAGHATRDGAEYACVFNYKIQDSLTTHGRRMRDAPLAELATANFARRHVDYDLAWWLVPHQAIPPHALEQARALEAPHSHDSEDGTAHGVGDGLRSC